VRLRKEATVRIFRTFSFSDISNIIMEIPAGSFIGAIKIKYSILEAGHNLVHLSGQILK